MPHKPRNKKEKEADKMDKQRMRAIPAESFYFHHIKHVFNFRNYMKVAKAKQRKAAIAADKKTSKTTTTAYGGGKRKTSDTFENSPNPKRASLDRNVSCSTSSYNESSPMKSNYLLYELEKNIIYKEMNYNQPIAIILSYFLIAILAFFMNTLYLLLYRVKLCMSKNLRLISLETV
jgi:hypothetical protein